MGRPEESIESTRVSNWSDGSSDPRLHLVLMTISGGIIEFDLKQDLEYTIGRSLNAEIHIDASSISRAHALFTISDGQVLLRDLKSTNGTFVNGVRVGDDPLEVQVGDALRFGDVVGQLRGSVGARSVGSRVLPPEEFDAVVASEADRCLRYDRELGVLAIEVVNGPVDSVGTVRRLVRSSMRALDAATERGLGRLDLLILEAGSETSRLAANRLADALGERQIEAKIGVAVFPSDVASPDSLVLAAQLAMRSAEIGGVEAAQEGARMLSVGELRVIVADRAMSRLYGLVERVASAELPVMIHGETGTGKELIATAIHTFGPRASKPLISINCAAVPENLLESELFGHEQGAFSGADRAKPGLYEQADGGILFLDEIGEMPLALQAKLLRVLEDGRIRRLGATEEIQVDVRVVAATHVDLRAAVDAGRFRQDLFYRLGAVRLEVPPLRERQREIALLAEQFAGSADKERQISIAPETMAVLAAYRWPGNVRELKNTIRAAVVMSDGTIRPEHLPPEIQSAAAEAGVDTSAPARTRSRPETRVPEVEPKDSAPEFRPIEEELRDLERSRMAAALEACDGNQTRAAKLIAMPLRTFQSKVKQYDLRRSRRGKR